LKGAYAEVFAFVDPAKDDDIKIRDAFRSYNPAGQQERMVTLFQGLCAAAGLIPEKAAPARQRAPASRTATAAPRQTVAQMVRRAAVPIKPLPPRNNGSLPPALAGLLESLPDTNIGWTAADRDKFVTTFKAVLDFCIPVVARLKPENDGHEGPS
jgi:hypothetical protein